MSLTPASDLLVQAATGRRLASLRMGIAWEGTLDVPRAKAIMDDPGGVEAAVMAE